MKKLILSLLLLCISVPSFADLGTTPVEYSCDEMYFAYYYEMEKIRSLWPKFQDLNSECNKPVMDWLRDPNKSFDKTGYRSSLLFTEEKKPALLEYFKALYELEEDLTVMDLQDQAKFEKMMDQNHSLPEVFSIKDVREMIKFEKNRVNAFIDRYSDAEFKRLKETMDTEWEPPVIGKGSLSTKGWGIFRIDLLGTPMSLDRAYMMECSQMYRGFGNSCEQDCLYLRNMLVDVHSKLKLFKQEWDWENDKMICTPQNNIKGAMIPFEASYCRLSCPGGDVPCNTCALKVTEKDKDYTPITCLSEVDARHAAELYCYMNGKENGCAELSCSKSYNANETAPLVVGARHELTKSKTDTHSIGGEIKLDIEAGLVGKGKTGIETEGNLVAEINSSMTYYSNESATIIKKYLTQREDGKLFECTYNQYKNEEPLDCGQVDAVNNHPEFSSSCHDKFKKFSTCKEHEMGEGRAFFNCSAYFSKVKNFAFKGYTGGVVDLTIPVVGGAKLEITGNSQHGWEFVETVSAVSKRFNAGGLTLKQMENTCDLWQHEWYSVSFKNQVDGTWFAKLLPEHWLKDNKHYINGDDLGIRCSVLNAKNIWEERDITTISAKIANEHIDEDEERYDPRFGKAHRSQSEKRLERVLQLSFKLDDRAWSRWFWFDGVSNYLAKDDPYPLVVAPIEKEWFSIPFENKHVQYITQISQGNVPYDLLKQFAADVFPLRNGRNHVKNCRVINFKGPEKR